MWLWVKSWLLSRVYLTIHDFCCECGTDLKASPLLASSPPPWLKPGSAFRLPCPSPLSRVAKLMGSMFNENGTAVGPWVSYLIFLCHLFTYKLGIIMVFNYRNSSIDEIIHIKWLSKFLLYTASISYNYYYQVGRNSQLTCHIDWEWISEQSLVHKISSPKIFQTRAGWESSLFPSDHADVRIWVWSSGTTLIWENDVNKRTETEVRGSSFFNSKNYTSTLQ